MNIEHLKLPPIPKLSEGIGDEWKKKQPTKKQLCYIKKMLPGRKPPTTRGEAAVIVDVLIAKTQNEKDNYFNEALEPYDFWWEED